MMKRILSTLLIVVLLFGNICNAQNLTQDIDRNTYYVGANTEQYVAQGLHNPEEYRRHRDDRDDRHRRHPKRHRHHRHHNHDDIDAGDIIAGILIYEIVKDIVD